ncbi:MAG: hypothetical protein JXM70_07575 [Pirellulales bacterium]|nr:hypothetical protein [Pirellulales bacterium]
MNKTVRQIFFAGIAALLLVSPATTARATDDIDEVMPSTLPALRPELQPAADRLYGALMRQAHYLLGTVHEWDEAPSMKLLTESKSAEYCIRPNTSTLVGLAVLRRWGPYEAEVVGVSRDQLLDEYIIPMMRYLVATHSTGDRTTGDGKPWGDAWQSAHWAYALGRAAWFVWDDLPADVRNGVRRVVAHEAGRFVDATPPHGMKRDTKAEENAWSSRIFSAAVLLMPNDVRRKVWEEAFVRWAISSFMRPSDAQCRQIVDGKPVADWFTGACIFEDSTCENHGFVHPGYMGCIGITLCCHIDFRLSGRVAPRAVAWNASGIYENLKWMATPDGGYIYPSGQDWALFRNPQKALLHLLMASFEGDTDGWSLAQQGWEAMDRMQARSTDGRVFLPDEYRFRSMQHDTIAMIGLQWLCLHVADPIRDEPTQRLGTRHLKSGGLVLHRTPNAFVTLSYGAKVMAQVAAMRLDRIVSPDQRSLIGSVFLADSKNPQKLQVSEVDVDVKDDRFTAKLCVDHGPRVRANLVFRTDSKGTLYVSEKLVAIKDVTINRVATGMIVVLNNKQWIYETGHRALKLDNESTTIPAHSGKTLAGEVTNIVIDDVMTITSDKPIRIHYVASEGPLRGRATDRLYLNYDNAKKKWKAGETISQYSATIRVEGQRR